MIGLESLAMDGDLGQGGIMGTRELLHQLRVLGAHRRHFGQLLLAQLLHTRWSWVIQKAKAVPDGTPKSLLQNSELCGDGP